MDNAAKRFYALTAGGAAIAAFLGASGAAHATSYYVTGAGNDAWSGRSLTASWRTLDSAVKHVRPGDVVNVGNGNFSNVKITCSGKPGAWIYFKGIPGTRPIAPVGVHGFGITVTQDPTTGAPAQYDDISGFEISGLDAVSGVAAYDSHGIDVNGWCSHVSVHDNVIHDCGTSGITVDGCDYVSIVHNKVYGCCGVSPYNSSGISLINMVWADGGAGFHNYIQNNTVYSNSDRDTTNLDDGLNPHGVATHTDGNAIAVDTSGGYHPGGSNGNGDSYDGAVWTPQTLVSGNNVWSNGGRAVCITQNDSVTVTNNDVAYDLTDTSLSYYADQREIAVLKSHDCHVYNNRVKGYTSEPYQTYHSNNVSADAPVHTTG